MCLLDDLPMAYHRTKKSYTDEFHVWKVTNIEPTKPLHHGEDGSTRTTTEGERPHHQQPHGAFGSQNIVLDIPFKDGIE